jgi:hypothetical protein
LIEEMRLYREEGCVFFDPASSRPVAVAEEWLKLPPFGSGSLRVACDSEATWSDFAASLPADSALFERISLLREGAVARLQERLALQQERTRQMVHQRLLDSFKAGYDELHPRKSTRLQLVEKFKAEKVQEENEKKMQTELINEEKKKLKRQKIEAKIMENVDREELKEILMAQAAVDREERKETLMAQVADDEQIMEDEEWNSRKTTKKQKKHQRRTKLEAEAKPTPLSSDSPSVPYKFDCFCDDSEEAQAMIQCEKCLVWKHLICVNRSLGAKKVWELPDWNSVDYVCPECSGAETAAEALAVDGGTNNMEHGHAGRTSDSKPVELVDQPQTLPLLTLPAESDGRPALTEEAEEIDILNFTDEEENSIDIDSRDLTLLEMIGTDPSQIEHAAHLLVQGASVPATGNAQTRSAVAVAAAIEDSASLPLNFLLDVSASALLQEENKHFL